MVVKIARKPMALSRITVPVQPPSEQKKKTLLFNQKKNYSMEMRKMSQPKPSLLTKNKLLKIIKKKLSIVSKLKLKH